MAVYVIVTYMTNVSAKYRCLEQATIDFAAQVAVLYSSSLVGEALANRHQPVDIID